MNFHIITLFPGIISQYTNESIIGRAIKQRHIKVKVLDLRQFGEGKRRTVDERAYGGGPGMVLKAEPILRAVVALKIKDKKKSLVIITSAGGKKFDENLAQNYLKYKNIIIICGHYEGIDERLKKVLKDRGYAVDEVSIGDYVLTGGELPALVMIDSVARKIPGVLGKFESLEENRLGAGVPSYTRPDTFKYKNKKYSVPKVLLSGHHADIAEWRLKNIKKRRSQQ